MSAAVLSYPEVSALAERAARGAGRPWGEAEEWGFSAAWLARRGQPWIAPLLGCLSGQMQGQRSGQGGPVEMAPGRWRGAGPLCPVRLGLALADFATLPEGPAAGLIDLGDVDHPLLLVPFVSLAARTAGVWFTLTADDAPPLVIGPDGLGQGTLPERAHLRLAPTGPSDPAAIQTAEALAAPVTRAQLAALEALALKMTVPSSARSERGAGAAGDDQD